MVISTKGPNWFDLHGGRMIFPGVIMLVLGGGIGVPLVCLGVRSMWQAIMSCSSSVDVSGMKTSDKSPHLKQDLLISFWGINSMHQLGIELLWTVVNLYAIHSQMIGTDKSVLHLVPIIEHLIQHKLVSLLASDRRTVTDCCHMTKDTSEIDLWVTERGTRDCFACKVQDNSVGSCNPCINMWIEFHLLARINIVICMTRQVLLVPISHMSWGLGGGISSSHQPLLQRTLLPTFCLRHGQTYDYHLNSTVIQQQVPLCLHLLAHQHFSHCNFVVDVALHCLPPLLMPCTWLSY